MDKDEQNEVTSRLRSAIKKKLSDISDFVDDELPEYIMILVANQRSKSQIEKDLSLFLREDTGNFTNWLWNLLNSINIGSRNEASKLKNDNPSAKKKDCDQDEDAVVLDCYLDEPETELLSHEDTNDSITTKSVMQSFKEVKDNVSKLGEESQQCSATGTIKKEKIEEKDKKTSFPESQKIDSKIWPESKVVDSFPKKALRTQPCSKVVPVKRQYVNSDDEYDPSKPELVRPSQSRNHRGPTAFQTNKLLLKAVNDAAKSILDGKNIDDFYKPTPIKVLSSRYLQTQKNVDSYDVEEPIHIAESSGSASKEQTIDPNFFDLDLRNLNTNVPESPSRTIFYTPITKTPEKDPDADVQPKSPHFIVTMEGVNLNSFKRKLDENSIESTEEEDMELDDSAEEISAAKKMKVSERCKFWPACKNSDSCLYHHPTTPCKCFPDCKFGDKCLYIHPNCKFDALCSRKECPFTHASKRKLPLTTLPLKMIPVKPHRTKIHCKYFPNCTAQSCPFIHPKLCRYGTECRSPSCMFGHLPVPPRSQLKWQASDL